ncbi:MAG TPA: flagellar hook capping FlgD N-terminal domain-containing protein, partial [Nevskiaceae bacterium]|nr:flagellar hook capping FlgD N-terminal domain-containing protein [Nevskiaceae bacterium]
MTASVDPSTLSALGLAQQASSKTASQTLDQADFLKLMTTQLQYQDPMKPLDNAEFVSQMAQFSTVSGIQSLQAASLVGRDVLVPASSGYLADGGVLAGGAQVSASGDVTVQIRDASGAVVRNLDLGTQPSGLATFVWDGKGDDGSTLPAG